MSNPSPSKFICWYVVLVHKYSLACSSLVLVCTYISTVFLYTYQYPPRHVCHPLPPPFPHPNLCHWTKCSLSNVVVASSAKSNHTTPASPDSPSPPALAPNRSALFSDSSKPVPNHGKPNCAPKPPGVKTVTNTINGLTATSNGNSGVTSSGRPTVSRHHSMKTTRYVFMEIRFGSISLLTRFV